MADNYNPYADVLNSLLKVGQQASTSFGNYAIWPVAEAGKAVANLSAIPGQQNLSNAVQGTQTQELNPTVGTPQTAFQPIDLGELQQNAANKALNKLLDNHANQALQQLGPERFVDAANNLGASQQTNDLGPAFAGQPQSTPQPSTQLLGYDQINNSIAQQLQGMAQSQNGLQRFFAPWTGPIDQQRLSNLGAIQKIAAGQPGEIGLPQAQSQAIQQRMAGQEPLQPIDLLNLQAARNTLSKDALNASSQRLQSEIDQTQKEMEFHQANRSLLGKAFGAFNISGENLSQYTKQLQSKIVDLKKVKANVDNQLSNFQPNTNMTSRFNNISPEAAQAELQRRGNK